MFAVHSQDFMQIYQKCITHDKDYRAFVTKCGPCASSYAGLGKNGTGPIVIWSEFECSSYLIRSEGYSCYEGRTFPEN